MFTAQVFFYCLYCALTFCLWTFVEPLLEPKPIVWFWTNLPWIFWNGAHSVMCLTFNRSIRGNVVALLRRSVSPQKSTSTMRKCYG
ncbi:hypothetical protein Y032_0005g2631 [Ancylostoma ceylanicum]|nr:hypothetical protein Y032_0005g2631 [Ancylostoma ceylanicum]